MSEDNFLKVAKQAAIEAGKIIQKYSGRSLSLSLKNEDKSDFATYADLESEEKIVEILSKNFPTHNIIAEEKNKINKGSEYTWVVDPLDGTISYAHGLPFFAVSIGLLKSNKPILGVINDVYSQDLYFAQEGLGAYLNGKTIRVSREKNLDGAVIDLDFGHKARRKQKIESYVNLLALKAGYPYSFGPAAGILALVGTGALDGYVAQGWQWDFAAGAVIVREAGGKVSDFAGNEPDWTKERLNIVASNGLIHEQILEALKK
ncbi:inositol monophosphatase [Candidatus Daviesbacteria bacterium]|nr:inositol monophosphatase [Candidatus Daviesbacteria bacterium]